MEKHFELNDAEFERQFINCQLDPALFSHEAHLRLAWININKYGLEQAEEKIQTQLQNFVAAVGAKDKYHKPLTIAAIKAVYHFMFKSNTNNFQDFITAFPKLKNNFKDLIGQHYSFNLFDSSEAKNHYLEPDLLPFS